MDYGLSEINNVIEDLEMLNEAISEDGIIDARKFLDSAKQIPEMIKQAKSAREYMKEMQQVECKCEIDQMKEIGMSQKDFI